MKLVGKRVAKAARIGSRKRAVVREKALAEVTSSGGKGGAVVKKK